MPPIPEPVPVTEVEIERIQKACEEAQEVIQIMHGVTKDLRAAIADARSVKQEFIALAEDAVDEAVGNILAEKLEQVAGFQQVAYDKILTGFDQAVNPLSKSVKLLTDHMKANGFNLPEFNGIEWKPPRPTSIEIEVQLTKPMHQKSNMGNRADRRRKNKR